MSSIPRLLLSIDVPVNVIQCPIMYLSLAKLEGKGVQIYIDQLGWKTNILNHTLHFHLCQPLKFQADSVSVILDTQLTAASSFQTILILTSYSFLNFIFSLQHIQ